MPNAGSFTYWYLQVPNLVLSAMIVLLLVRLVLALIVNEGAMIIRPLVAITHPVVATVGWVTPRIIPPLGVVACAVVWLAAVRTVLFMIALAMGIRL